jgi:anti-anti-sigma factor
MTTTLRIDAPRMITIKNSAALRNHLLDQLEDGARDFVIGLESTTYVDSTGLALFADLQRVLVREMGMRLRISGASPEIRLLFEATRLAAVLEMVDPADYAAAAPRLAPNEWTAAVAAA